MKAHDPTRPLTFGAFIASIYGNCGAQHAAGIVRFALDAQLVRFCGAPHATLPYSASPAILSPSHRLAARST